MEELEIQCAQCGEIFVLRKAEREELESKRRKISKYCPICRKAYRIKTQKEKEEIQKIENDKAWKIKNEKDLKVFEEKLLKWNVVTLDGAKPGGNERVLYAIGNGFDIMHRVKSSYADFGKTLGKNSNLRFYLENYLDVDDLWGDFEGALAKIRVDATCSDYILDMWLDNMGAYDEDAGAAEFFAAAEMAAAPITELNHELKKRFGAWIRSLAVNTDDRPLSDLINPNALFLTFNYTEFVETMYGVDEEKVCYIHGCRRKKKGFPREELILGHMPGASDDQYVYKTNFSGISRKHSQMVYDAQQTALRFVGEADDDLTKDCSEIIKKHKEFFDKTIDADHVITIGHSLYPVDWEYFAEVLNTVKDKDKLKWTFGCYSAADLERVESFVSEHNIPFDNIRIYRTDLISTTPKPVIENEDAVKAKAKKKTAIDKTISASADGRWKVVTNDRKCSIVDAISGEKIFTRVFLSIINEAVFDKSGNTLLLIIRGLFDGVFLVRFVDDKWSYIKELEGIPNQGVINRRLRKIILEQNHLTFVYNSRVRKYSLSDGALIYNRGVRGAAEHEYVGEVIMDKFYK